MCVAACVGSSHQSVHLHLGRLEDGLVVSEHIIKQSKTLRWFGDHSNQLVSDASKDAFCSDNEHTMQAPSGSNDVQTALSTLVFLVNRIKWSASSCRRRAVKKTQSVPGSVRIVVMLFDVLRASKMFQRETRFGASTGIAEINVPALEPVSIVSSIETIHRLNWISTVSNGTSSRGRRLKPTSSVQPGQERQLSARIDVMASAGVHQTQAAAQRWLPPIKRRLRSASAHQACQGDNQNTTDDLFAGVTYS